MEDNVEGTYRDYNNNKSTNDLFEYRRYKAEDCTTAHTHGYSYCRICKKPAIPYVYDGLLADMGQPPVFCDACAVDMAEVARTQMEARRRANT